MNGVLRKDVKAFRFEPHTSPGRGIASSKQVRGPQHNMLAIANVNQDIETALKQDKGGGGPWPPLAPL